MFQSLEELGRNRRSLRRRRLLIMGLTGIGGWFAYRWWGFRARPVSNRQTEFVTANRDFFTVSIRTGFRPQVTEADYRLLVEGPDHSLHLSLQDLQSLDRRVEFRTLACVGNGIGGPGIGNAAWTVTPLAPLLRRVADAVKSPLWVEFEGLDGFYSSVDWVAATDPEAVLAYEMNGEPLPPAHGFPLRVILPDRYGMKQPRWLRRISVVSRNPSGYWERRGWCSECRIRMTARIDSAKPRSDGLWEVAGIAFCGQSRVGRVEVSDDRGNTWRAAALNEPVLPHAWAKWRWDWRPASRGPWVLTVRVEAEDGSRQIDSYGGSFPSGATGYHRVSVEV